MAKIVVLYFADDGDADELVACLQSNPEMGYHFHDHPDPRFRRPAILTGGQELNLRPELIGVYKYPTKYCEHLLGDREQMRLVRRGMKYGWWIHSGTKQQPGCGLARRRYQTPANLLFPPGKLPPRQEVSHHLHTDPETGTHSISLLGGGKDLSK